MRIQVWNHQQEHRYRKVLRGIAQLREISGSRARLIYQIYYINLSNSIAEDRGSSPGGKGLKTP